MDSKIPQYKGTNIIHLRKRLLAAGKEQEQQFCESLRPDELIIYQKALNIGWYPIGKVAKIFTQAVNVLYAKEPKPLRALGKDQALDNLNGIYKVILHIVDTGTAISQSARFWKTHFDRGDAQGGHDPADAKGRQQGTLIVRNYPELPSAFMDIVEGYILGVLEFTHSQMLDSHYDAKDPMERRWIYGYR